MRSESVEFYSDGLRLRGTVALVTGGATGIGRAVALALAERGADVGIGYCSSETAALSARAAARAAGVRAEVFQADLSQADAPAALVAAAVQAFGRLDVLVNSAGTTVWVPFSDVGALDAAKWDHVMAVNLRASFLCAAAASQAMGDAGGVIVNVASLSGIKPRASSIAYAASKAGVVHLTRCLAEGLWPRVRVNAIAPGNVPTDWGRRTGRPADYDTGVEIPIEVVARAVLDLIERDDATGEVVVLEGGSAVAR